MLTVQLEKWSCSYNKAFDASTPTSSAVLKVDSGFLVSTYLWTKGQHRGGSLGDTEEVQQGKSRCQTICADIVACQSRWLIRLASNPELSLSNLTLFPRSSLLEQCNLTRPEPLPLESDLGALLTLHQNAATGGTGWAMARGSVFISFQAFAR